MGVLTLGQMIGRVPQRWGARSLMLCPVIHERRRVNDAHAHQAAFVTLMVGGEYSETAARRSFRYDRFSAVYHPPQLEHRDVIGGPGVRLVMFEFEPDLVDDLHHTGLQSMRDLTGTPAAWRILSLYRDAVTGHDALDFEARALQVIADVVRTPSKIPLDPPALSRARDYVHAHFCERITMHDVAGAAALHPVYLGQLFQERSGETIGSYVARLRVRAAAEELSSTETPLSDVALAHGFCDQSHFNRVFKKVSGLTPAAFRAKFTERRVSSARPNAFPVRSRSTSAFID